MVAYHSGGEGYSLIAVTNIRLTDLWRLFAAEPYQAAAVNFPNLRRQSSSCKLKSALVGDNAPRRTSRLARALGRSSAVPAEQRGLARVGYKILPNLPS